MDTIFVSLDNLASIRVDPVTRCGELVVRLDDQISVRIELDADTVRQIEGVLAEV